MSHDRDETSDQRRHHEDKTAILTAVAVAQQNWSDVGDIIFGSRSDHAARTELMDRYSFTHLQAVAVLDMQFRNLLPTNREDLLEELDRLTDSQQGMS